MQRLLPCVLGSCLGQVVSASPSHQRPGLAWPTCQADTLGVALAPNGHLACVSILTCPRATAETSGTCREKETEPVRRGETGVWASSWVLGGKGLMMGKQEPGRAVVSVQPLRTLRWTQAFGTQGLMLIKQQLPLSDQLLWAM